MCAALMKSTMVLFICLVVKMSGAQNPPNGLSVSAQAGKESASGSGLSNQSASGKGIRVGGSASSSSQVNSDGSSSGQGAASGGISGEIATTPITTPQPPPKTQASTTLASETDTDEPPPPPPPFDPSDIPPPWLPTPEPPVPVMVTGPIVYPEIISPGGIPSPQVPGVWEALDILRGKQLLTAEEIQVILATSIAGQDYPILDQIPDTRFNCAGVKQAGFYADVETDCQVIRRCDLDGNQFNYLCPNATVFNQIVLVCDWFFNVDCSKSSQFYDYSNSRLYHQDWVLLDTPAERT